MSPASARDLLHARRPRRADAARNFDALLAAGAEVLAEQGRDAALEEVARRAGVGIGTLYRNFPTREDLIEAVYLLEVDAVCRYAAELVDQEPWAALTIWLHRFADFVDAKPALIAGLRDSSAAFAASRATSRAAITPLVERAQNAGVVRPDITPEEVLRLAAGVGTMTFPDPGRRGHVIDVALDGLRPPAGRADPPAAADPPPLKP